MNLCADIPSPTLQALCAAISQRLSVDLLLTTLIHSKFDLIHNLLPLLNNRLRLAPLLHHPHYRHQISSTLLTTRANQQLSCHH